MVVDLTHAGLNKPKLYLRKGYEVGAVLKFSYQLSEQWALQLKHNQGYRYFPRTDPVIVRSGLNSKSLVEPESKNYFQGYWAGLRSEEHTSELQSRPHLVCRLLLEIKK